MSTPEIGTWGQDKLKKAETDDGKGITVMPTQPLATLGILQRAIENTTDVERLGKLWELYKEWNAHEAKKAFDSALAAFKEHAPEIAKNRKVSYETKSGVKVEYKHATLDRVTGAIAAGLSEHGLSANWRTGQENGKIRVTCVLRHKDGHTEDMATLEAPPDDSGSKNPAQAVVSTATFLERHTLTASLGLATRDDADGITFADVEDALNDINSAITLDELQDRFAKAYKRAHAAKDKAHMAIVIEAKDNRKKALLTKNPKAEEQMAEFTKLAEMAGLNTAARNMLIGQHQGNLEAAIAEIKKSIQVASEINKEVASKPSAERPSGNQAEGRTRSAKGKGGSKAGTELTRNDQTPAAEPPSPPKEGDLGF